jgi:Domain of unknown function (DUF4386)
MNAQKAGGVGALLQGIFFLLILIVIFTVLPGLGLQGPSDFADPAKVLPLVANHPLVAFMLFPGDLLFAVFLVFAVLGVYDRFYGRSPALIRLATAAGLVATVLILANGTIGMSIIQVARDYVHDPASAATTFRILTLVSSNGVGLISGGIFAYGWWAVLISWVALRTGSPSKPVHYLGLVFGAAGILAIAIPPLGFLGPVVGVIWCTWFGTVLMRD